MSIIESQWILPSHLAHRKRDDPSKADTGWNQFQGTFSRRLATLREQRLLAVPAPRHRVALRHRRHGSRCSDPDDCADRSGRVVVFVLPEHRRRLGVRDPGDARRGCSGPYRGRARTREAAERLRAELDVDDAGRAQHDQERPGEHRHAYPSRRPPDVPSPAAATSPKSARMLPLDERDYLSGDIAARWRDLVGTIPDAVSLYVQHRLLQRGRARQPGAHRARRRGTASRRRRVARRALPVRRRLRHQRFVRAGKQEIKLDLLPEARNLGSRYRISPGKCVTRSTARRCNAIQRGPDDVRVMVRFPEAERQSIGNLEDMRIRAPDGSEVPFTSVARFELGRGYSKIERVDGQRVIKVTADVDRGVVTPEEVNESSARTGIIADLEQSIRRSRRARRASAASAQGHAGPRPRRAAVARSSSMRCWRFRCARTSSPWSSCRVIPFGAVGAIVGHFIMDVQLMFFSMLGIVASRRRRRERKPRARGLHQPSRREGVPLASSGG